MKVEINKSLFDESQIIVLKEIIRSIDDELIEIIPDIKKRKEIVYNLVFSMGAILDNSRVMEGKNGFITPVLTFAKIEDDFSVLISNGNTSFIHEYAHGFVEDYYHNYKEKDI